HDEVVELGRILEEQAREVGAGRTGLAQDAAFHSAIAHSAHNRAITRIVTALMDLLTQTREESLHTPGRPERSHQDHRQILAAIQAPDEGAARRLMPGHLIAVERLVGGREASAEGAEPETRPEGSAPAPRAAGAGRRRSPR